MSADPFGASNPFGITVPAKPAEHIDVHEKRRVEEPEPEEETDDVLFVDDDPFAPKPRQYVSPALPPIKTEAVQSELADSVKQVAAANLSFSATAVEQGVKEIIAAASPTSSAIESLSPDDWIKQAVGILKLSADERKESALQYAARKKIRLESSMVRGAASEEGFAALCSFLRISPMGVPWSKVNTVEIVSSQRCPGRAMELAYWTYTFKVYSILEQFQSQPRYEGQKETHYNTIKGVVTLTFDRRYSDFEWLRKCLLLEAPGVLVPPIPSKTIQSFKEKLQQKGEATVEGRDVEDAGKDEAVWEEDQAVQACNMCQVKFTFTTRRHHCRNCKKVFCSNCCPKSSTKRLCKTCGKSKGLGEALQSNGDIAFRLKELQLFLVEVMAGPFATSKAVQFFIEAPPTLLQQKKDSMLKEIAQRNQLWMKGTGDLFKEKVCDVQAAFGNEGTAGLSPRTSTRKAHAMRLSRTVTSFSVVRDDISRQLVEGLRRRPTEVPDIDKNFKNFEDLKALRKAVIHVDASSAQFRVHNKELMFALIAQTTFLIGMSRSMIELLHHMDVMCLRRKALASNPHKLTELNNFLDEREPILIRELEYLRRFSAVTWKKVCSYLWKLERNRDPCDYQWSALGDAVAEMSDPVFPKSEGNLPPP